MPDTQYRAKPNGANLREEPSLKARVLITTAPGTVLHLDPQRSTDTDKAGHRWIPVVMVRGWVRDDTVEVLQPTEAIK